MQKNNLSLIKACKRGNQVALIQLYDMYCQAMFTIACRYLNNEEDAKDAMQEGFLKAFASLEKYKPTYSFGSWLKRIIINQCIDQLKKTKLEFISVNDTALNKTIEEDNWNIDQEINRKHVIKAIEELPKKYNIVTTLYLIEGYDHEEISKILDIPVKTSRTQLHRGKLLLKQQLKNINYAKRY